MSLNRKQRRAGKAKHAPVATAPDPIASALEMIREVHNSGDIAQARQMYMQILGVAPNNADVLHLLGVTYYQTGDFGQSVALIGKAIELNPSNTAYLNNIGNAFVGLRKFDIAVEYYKKALNLKSNYIDAINNCGAALHELGLWQEEVQLYSIGLKAHPGNGLLLCNIIKTKQEACDWLGLDGHIETLLALTKQSLKNNQLCALSPYLSLCLPFTLQEQRQIAENYAAQFNSQVLEEIRKTNRDNNAKIRIGYVSADFRDHPTAHLIEGVLANHNRNNFEVFAYSTGIDDGSVFRNKIKASCDNFIDLFNMSDKDAARLIRADKIDILMDVMGYIQNARPGIFALRPAAIQVNYLAYPGTTGAIYIDYIVTDKTVLPENELKYFSEKPIYMPDTYFATNPGQAISGPPTRLECGLAEDVFVFCCFNKSNKINAEVFDAWARILKSVPRSVLWLFATNNYAIENLKREAELRGIDAGRLVFAGRLPKDQHLARHKLADLFLDCFNVCAHTTAIDSLFAGVPVIARQGNNIISRASASILKAVGMDRLVTSSIQDYEDLAIDYATNPEKLAVLKAELVNNIKDKPLFNIKAYTENLEKRIYEITAD